MFMHKTLVELKTKLAEAKETEESLLRQIEGYRQNIKDLRDDIKLLERSHELEIQERLGKLRKDMQESLISADLAVADAKARLETYKEMDTKDDSKKIREMLADAIKGLTVQAKVQVVR